MNYFLNELYKELEKAKIIKDYIFSSKENFLSEELWKTELDKAYKKNKEIIEKIKSYR